MARINLVVGRDPRRLLDHAAAEFLTSAARTADDPFPSPPYLLALRQGGLRDDLIALAAERGVAGWFDPPLCVFHELPEWLGATARIPIPDFSRAALLAKIIRETDGTVFARIRRVDDYLEAVEAFVGELVAEGVGPEAFQAAVAAVKHRDPFERARDRELVAIYARYVKELEGAGLRDGRDTLVDCATAVRADPRGLTERLGGRREIRFFGVQDLRGGWRALLRSLAASRAVDRVALYSAEAIALRADVEVEVITLPEPDDAAARLFRSSMRGGDHFETIEAATVERELSEVARRIRHLAGRGVSLHRIAVVSRRARPYVDMTLRALHKFGVPATARRRYVYREIPVVQAVLALYGAAAAGWSRGTLVDLADSPYFDHRLDAGTLNFVGFRRPVRGLAAWEAALRQLERESRGYEEEQKAAKELREQPPPPSRRVVAARAAFAAFAVLARQLEGFRRLGAWLLGLLQFVEEDPWGIEARIYAVPEDRFDLAKRDLAGWRGLRQIVNEWSDALERWGGADQVLTTAQFHERLTEMLAGDAAVWTETRRGVRVLESLAAAYRRFDHVFLVGMEAGRFPLHAPSSPIIGEAERAALVAAGLPLDLRSDWEERERRLFRVLVAGAGERLTISYPSLSANGSEVIRSAFVEALADVVTEVPAMVDRAAVFTPEMPLHRSPEIARHAARVAGIERLRERGDSSPYNGQIESPELLAWLAVEFGDDRLWSPTQLEAYAKCPWAYFSSRLLRVEHLEDPDDELEPVLRGRLLHDALARFYETAVARNDGQPVFLRTPDLEWAESMLLGALDGALEGFERTAWLGAPVLRESKREELRRLLRGYLRWEISLHEDMYNSRKRIAPRMLRTAVALHERRFDEAILERDGVRFRFRGTVDRVEIGVDERIADANTFVAAVDYKTTRAAAPGGGDKEAWDDGVVLQLPLYAFALEQLVPDARVARVEYRVLVQREAVHSLELHRVDRKTDSRYPHLEDQERYERALNTVPRWVKSVRTGTFAARPAPSCLCPRFCHAWDICRVAGGPKAKEPWR